jgi:hypothetical protein
MRVRGREDLYRRDCLKILLPSETFANVGDPVMQPTDRVSAM